MKNLKELCLKYFDTDNLYTVFHIKKEATEAEVKNAYRRLSLKVHPDKVGEEDKEEASEKFKIVCQIHKILSDPKTRKSYDRSGDIDDDISDDWLDYWRSIFKEVTVEEIMKYEEKYKGSDEEKSDIRESYLNSGGDMDVIMESVPFAGLEDEPRIKSIILAMIENDEVPDHKIFSEEPEKKRIKREKKMKRDRAAFEKQQEKDAKKKGDEENGFGALQMAIQARQKRSAEGVDDFFSALEAKYCNGGGSKKKSGTRTSKRNK